MNRLQVLSHQISSQYNKLVVETKNNIGTIYMNSAKDLNSLDTEMRQQIGRALHQLEGNNQVKVIVILSKVAKAFCAGANIKDIASQKIKYEDIFHKFHNAFSGIRKPIIAGVNGIAFGGGLQLAFLCDMIIFADDARIGFPEIKLGVIPGIGGTQKLGRFIGKNNAMIHILTGQPIAIDQIKQAGIAPVVPRQSLQQQVLKIAQKIAQKSRAAITAAKLAVSYSQQLPLSQGYKFERQIFLPLTQTEGAREGLTAFIEKRKPIFK